MIESEIRVWFKADTTLVSEELLDSNQSTPTLVGEETVPAEETIDESARRPTVAACVATRLKSAAPAPANSAARFKNEFVYAAVPA